MSSLPRLELQQKGSTLQPPLFPSPPPPPLLGCKPDLVPNCLKTWLDSKTDAIVTILRDDWLTWNMHMSSTLFSKKVWVSQRPVERPVGSSTTYYILSANIFLRFQRKMNFLPFTAFAIVAVIQGGEFLRFFFLHVWRNMHIFASKSVTGLFDAHLVLSILELKAFKILAF